MEKEHRHAGTAVQGREGELEVAFLVLFRIGIVFLSAGKSARIFFLVICFGGSHGQIAGKKRATGNSPGQK